MKRFTKFIISITCALSFSSCNRRHVHDWNDPTYIWAEDYSSCTAKVVCKQDSSHYLEETNSSTYVLIDNDQILGKYVVSFDDEHFTEQIITIEKDHDALRESEGIVPSCEDIDKLDTYKHVVVFGIDGVGAQFKQVDTPYFDMIFEGGSINYHGIAQYPTMSAENWESMFTGVKSSTHGIINSIATLYPKDNNYPTVFKTYSSINEDATMSSIVNWSSINNGLIENDVPNLTKMNMSENVYSLFPAEIDRHIANEASNRVNDTILFLQFDSIDYVGHMYGSNSKNYSDTIKSIDEYLYIVYEAFEEAGLLEDTLFIATSDHGHAPSGGHGGDSLDEREVMLAVKDFKGQVINGSSEKYVTHDLASIILYALGVKQPSYYEGGVPKNLFNTL